MSLAAVLIHIDSRLHQLGRMPGAVAAILDALHVRGLRAGLVGTRLIDAVQDRCEKAGLAWEDILVVPEVRGPALTAAATALAGTPARAALITPTPEVVAAAQRVGFLSVGVATASSPRALRRAGARVVYSDLAEVEQQLDEALQLLAPRSLDLTVEAMEALMDEALAEARSGQEAGEVPIGSVLVRGDGQILARGHNEAKALQLKIAHAEMQTCYHAAGQLPNDARDLVLVTTLEPCVMCLGAAMNLHVDTVVYALEAPTNGGIARVQAYDTPGSYLPRFVGGIRRAESLALLADWAATRPQATFMQDLLARV